MRTENISLREMYLHLVVWASFWLASWGKRMEIERIKRDLEDARRLLADVSLEQASGLPVNPLTAQLIDLVLRLSEGTAWLLAEREAFASRLQRTPRPAISIAAGGRLDEAQATQSAALTL